MAEGLDLLDDIGLILSIFILLFISYFVLLTTNEHGIEKWGLLW